MEKSQRAPGVIVGYIVRWHDGDGIQEAGNSAVRIHHTGVSWTVSKHGQLLVRDRKGRQVARYRQFVWTYVYLKADECEGQSAEGVQHSRSD